MSSRPWLALIVIVFVGVTLRGMYLREIVNAPDFFHPTAIDSDYHDDWARGIVTGDWRARNRQTVLEIPDVAYFRPPGYAHFLAGVYAVSGSSYLAARTAQMCVGMMSCILGYFLGKRWFGSTVGLIFAAFMSVYWVFIFYEGELHAPFLLVFLGLAVLWTLGRCVEACGFRRALLSGISLGLFAVTRPNILIFMPFVLGWFWSVLKAARNVRALPRAAVGFLLGSAIVILPVTIRNYLVSGDLVLISSNVGLALLVGNNEKATGVGDGVLPVLPGLMDRSGWTTYDYPQVVRGLEERLARSLTYSDASRHFAAQALQYVRTHPLEWCRLTAKKVAIWWGPTEFDSNKELHYARQDSPLLRNLPGSFAMALSTAIVGAAFLLYDLRQAGKTGSGKHESDVKRHQVTVLLLLYVAAYSASFLPFAITTRYRLPIVPVLLLLGAYGLYRAARFAARRDVRTVASCAVVWAGSYALARTSFAGDQPDRGRWHYHRGVAYVRDGRMGRAVEEFRAAVRLRPDRADAHGNLGLVLLAINGPAEAIGPLSEAVRLNPHMVEARAGLAAALMAQGEIDAAIEQLTEVLRILPTCTKAHRDLAAALLKQGKTDDAVRHFVEALRLDPGHVQTRISLGAVLVRQERIDEAIEHFSEAVRLDPDNAKAHRGLAAALAQQGRIDQAVRHLREVVRLRPDWPVPLNNLASILATHEGPNLPDPARAVELAARACKLTEYERPVMLDTLAAAYAAAGRFREAVATAQKAIGLASAAGEERLATSIRSRLRLYEAGRPYRRPLPASVPSNRQ